MGLGNNSNVINYLQIVNGKFALKVDAATKSSVSRMNRNNQIVHEELYGQCGGYLTNISFQDGTFGTELHIEITERGVKYKIQTLAVSNYAEDFLNRLLNIKLDQVIELHVFEEKVVNEDNSYMKGVLFIKDQNNKNIPKYFSSQNRKNLPEWEKITDDQGKTKFDKSKRIDFYKKMVSQFVFTPPTTPVVQQQAKIQALPEFMNQSLNSEDFPF
jgi:hypothetical protein